MNFSTQAFQNALLRWFHSHKRDLPWREKYEPYHVWLSEIMLQQTQMERGVAYFLRWINRYPDVSSIAESSIDEILKYWEGLGYYARARNLHKAAILICNDHSGIIPGSYEELLKLPGIGPYTASAVASIAFGENIAVVDANVERVFARIFDIDRPLKSKGVHKKITDLAGRLLVKGQARDFNQALMDLGGIICTPKNPDCGNCPVADQCLAYNGNFVDDRPVLTKQTQQIHIEMATGMLVKNGTVFIQQRNDDDIWGGLWEFPGGRLEPGEMPEQTVVREYDEETGFTVEICNKITTVVHYFTKYKVTLHCYLCKLRQDSMLPQLTAAQKYHWVTGDQLGNYGFPAGHRKMIEFIRETCPASFLRDC